MIFVYKKNAQLDVGEVEGGIDATAFVFDTDHLDCKFHRRDDNLNYWEYPIGTTLTKADSFFMIAKMKTPANMGGTNNAAGYIGYRDNVTIYSTWNHVMALWGVADPGKVWAQIRASDGTYYHSGDLGQFYVLSTETTYYIAVIFNTTTKVCTVKIYDSAKTLLSTLNTPPIAVTKDFTLDSSGFSGYAGGGTTTGSFAGEWIITEIKANSGIEEEEFGGKKNDMVCVC